MLRQGSVNVATGLRGSRIRLQQLMIEKNQIESEGAIAFSEYFKELDCLEKLDISENQIEQDGFEELFKSL